MSTKETASQRWLMFSKLWSCHNKAQGRPRQNQHNSDEQGIRKSQQRGWDSPSNSKRDNRSPKDGDNKLKHFFKCNATLNKRLDLQNIEDQKCICNKGRLVISTPLQWQATMWYHHYFQHLGHTRLEGTMDTMIYWKEMQKTVQSITKSCKSCQVNKRCQLKYGHLPSKTVISTPW